MEVKKMGEKHNILTRKCCCINLQKRHTLPPIVKEVSCPTFSCKLGKGMDSDKIPKFNFEYNVYKLCL